jgi:type IV pilus assembly protein PilA
MEMREKGMRKQKGFSLIELLIVVAIILIIAAIAIPNLLRARIAANESSAVASERTINTAEIEYSTAFPTNGYAAALTNLGPGAACPNPPTAVQACIIDNLLAAAGAAPGKSGYLFTAVGGGAVAGVNTTYVTDANPITVNTTGVRSFCAVQDAVIRLGNAAACTGGGALPLNQ